MGPSTELAASPAWKEGSSGASLGRALAAAGGQVTSPCAIQTLQITQITLYPGAKALLGEGRFKLVASEHNKSKTRQRLQKSPRGSRRFYEPVIFTIIQ